MSSTIVHCHYRYVNWLSYIHRVIGLIINCNTSHQCDDRFNGDLDNLLCMGMSVTQTEITQFKQNLQVRFSWVRPIPTEI